MKPARKGAGGKSVRVPGKTPVDGEHSRAKGQHRVRVLMVESNAVSHAASANPTVHTSEQSYESTFSCFLECLLLLNYLLTLSLWQAG